MASVVGHALGAAVAWEAGRRLFGPRMPQGAAWYLLPAALAVLPDMDVMLPILAGVRAAHRGASHSVLAAAAMAALATGAVLAAGGARHWGPLFVTLFACALVHPALDYLMGCGPPVPLLWPLIAKGWLCSVQLIPTAYYPRTAGGLVAIVLRQETWAGMGLEVLSLGGLWAAVAAGPLVWKAVGFAASAAGFALTYLAYN